MTIFRTSFVLSLFASIITLTACADPAPLYVDQAWVRPNPNGEGPAAGYFVIHGGEEAVQLRRVSTDGALRVEMHESLMKDGMMTMQPIEAVEVPAKSEVSFAPGGKHIMLFGLNPAVVEAGTIEMTMLFSDGSRLIVDAEIQKPGTAQAATNAMAHGENGDGPEVEAGEHAH